jgi:N utilization substance protein B
MGIRRKSRELALQALFYMDIHQNRSAELLYRFCDNFVPSDKVRPFFMKLVAGVMKTQAQIDAVIEQYSQNWRLSRMSCVDRNIMRIAVYEILCCGDIPSKVSINEAIDIGKKYGTEESGAFINGIIDSIRIAHEKDPIRLDSDPVNSTV